MGIKLKKYCLSLRPTANKWINYKKILKIMKRHFTDENQFKFLQMLDDFARSEGLSINDENTFKRFTDYLSVTVKKHRDNPVLVHGFRIESMFAHIAAAMGKCKLITEEDSGSFLA